MLIALGSTLALAGATLAVLLVPSDATDGPRARPVPEETVPIETPIETPSEIPSVDVSLGGSLRPVADATVDATNPNAIDGTSDALRTAAWPEIRSYIRFNVPAFRGAVRKATVSFVPLNSSASGFEIYLAQGAWQEDSVTFDNAPRLLRVLDSTGPIEPGRRIELDVTPAITGRGKYTFAIVMSGSVPVAVASRESGDSALLSLATGRWCRGVMIRPGRSIAAAIDDHGPGTTFCLRAGVHRLIDRLHPQDRQRFIGEQGAILNGSRRLTSFRNEGGFWIADEQTQELPGGIGECRQAGYTGCQFPERVFFDGKSLWQVTSLSDLSLGEFFFDHEADRIYLANDPEGHLVETTVATGAFAGWPGRGVVVRNLVIEKFGTPAQGASLGDQGADGWLIVGNEVRNNAGVGICGGPDVLVRANYVHHQGQLGMCGQRAGGTYKNNTLSHNNVDGFAVGWEAGGAKWVATTNLTVFGNYVHDNFGMGLWTDGGNYRTTYLNNRVERNQGLGILYEISDDAVIGDNFIRRNGALTHAALDGAGIMVASSSNVEVRDNTLIDNADGIALKQHSTESGDHGAFLVEDAYVHDNVILMCEGESGGVQTVGSDAIYTSLNNRFDQNTYLLGPGRTEFWRWLDDFQTRQQWVALGQDVHSEFEGTDC